MSAELVVEDCNSLLVVCGNCGWTRVWFVAQIRDRYLTPETPVASLPARIRCDGCRTAALSFEAFPVRRHQMEAS